MHAADSPRSEHPAAAHHLTGLNCDVHMGPFSKNGRSFFENPEEAEEPKKVNMWTTALTF